MRNITLSIIHHRYKVVIAIYVVKDQLINQQLQKLKIVKWSSSKKCWYAPATSENLRLLRHTFKDHFVEMDFEETDLASEPEAGKLIVPAAWVRKKNIAETASSYPLCVQNLQAIKKMEEQLILKSYSASTRRTYQTEFLQLLKLLKEKCVDDLDSQDIKRYMAFALNKLKISEATAHSRLNALKFYFEQVLRREKFFYDIPRPKKQFQLPGFFSQEEIARILRGTENIKHKTMLMMAYSTGMRVSEVVSLRVADIDSSRMQIKIRQAKGKKDRMTPLSPVLLVMLREYYLAYHPSAKGFLFSGQEDGTPYSIRALQSVLQEAKKRAQLLKPGGMHALRHSFATHLIDKGTDVTMIMKLLGHNDLKTTLRYLHVTNRDILQIVSPLDSLDLDKK